MKQVLSLMLVSAAISGCATGTDGAKPIGPNLYMIGGLGSFTDFSGSTVKARYFEQASAFCASKGLVMNPVNSTGQDSGYGTYASAEVIFKCLPSIETPTPKTN